MDVPAQEPAPLEILSCLAAVPPGRGVAMLIRHAERPALPRGELGDQIPLTEAGFRAARRLGQDLGRELRRVFTSPVLRCRQTAQSLVEGASSPVVPVELSHLGEPGLFVVDGLLAWPYFLQHGVMGMAARLLRGEVLPGMRSAEVGTRVLLEDGLRAPPPAGKIDLYVSHDYIINVVASVLVGRELTWPSFLSGLCLWTDAGGLGVSVPDQTRIVPLDSPLLRGAD